MINLRSIKSALHSDGQAKVPDKRFRRRQTMIFAMTLFVFVILLLTAALIGAVVILLVRTGLIVVHQGSSGLITGVVTLMIFSVVIGTSMFALFGQRPLRPVRNLKQAVHEIMGGNYSVRVEKSSIPELDALISDFNAMTAELGSVESLRNDFINNFSHEFRTPIVSIRGFAKLLKNDQLTAEERHEFLDIIIEESDRLVQLSSNVLNLSKLESQTMILEKSSFALDEQLRRVIVFLEPAWRKKHLTFFVDLEAVQINSNPEILKQAWINLISNAIKFTPDGGQIRVSLSSPATVEIADSGIGMDEETKDRIFEKFYQGDSSRAELGHGLGLALVKRIIDLCGGQIDVESEPYEGSTFRVKLPAD